MAHNYIRPKNEVKKIVKDNIRTNRMGAITPSTHLFVLGIILDEIYNAISSPILERPVLEAALKEKIFYNTLKQVTPTLHIEAMDLLWDEIYNFPSAVPNLSKSANQTLVDNVLLKTTAESIKPANHQQALFYLIDELYHIFNVPLPPTNLTVEGDNGNIDIEWLPPNDDIVGYNVYLDDVQQNTDPITSLNYNWTGLNTGQSYNIDVESVHSNGKTSTQVSTDYISLDTIAPDAPTLNLIFSGNSTVTVEIVEPAESLGIDYTLYRNGVPIATDLSSGFYVDNTVTNGVTYTYYATSVDPSGNESTPSNSIETTPVNLNNTQSLQLDSSTQIELPSGVIDRSQYTVMFWVKPNEIPDSTIGRKAIFTATSVNGHAWLLELSQGATDQYYGNFNIGIKNGLASSTASATSGIYPQKPGGGGGTTTNIDKLPRDVWYHIAIVVNNGVLQWYWNGQLVDEDNSALLSVPDNYGGTWYLGDAIQGNGSPTSQIDLLSIWDTALTEDQVREYVYNIDHSDESNCIHFYKFAGNLVDEKGNFDLTLSAGSPTYPTNSPIETNTSIPPVSGFGYLLQQSASVGPFTLAGGAGAGLTNTGYWNTFFTGAVPSLGTDTVGAINKFGDLYLGSSDGDYAIIKATGLYKWRNVLPDTSKDLNRAVFIDPNLDMFAFVEDNGGTGLWDELKKFSYTDGSELASYNVPDGEICLRAALCDSLGNVYIAITDGSGNHKVRKLANDLSGTVAGWTENTIAIGGSGNIDIRNLYIDVHNNRIFLPNAQSSNNTLAHVIDLSDGSILGTLETNDSEDQAQVVLWSPRHNEYWVVTSGAIKAYDIDYNYIADRIVDGSKTFTPSDLLYDDLDTAGVWDNTGRQLVVYTINNATKAWTEVNTIGVNSGSARGQFVVPGNRALYDAS